MIIETLKLLLIASASTETDMIKVVDVSNLNCLSAAYVAEEQTISGGASCSDLSGLLLRAKNSGFTHVTGMINAASKWDPYTSSTHNYFAEAVISANTYGLGVIPILGVSDRSFVGEGWSQSFNIPPIQLLGNALVSGAGKNQFNTACKDTITPQQVDFKDCYASTPWTPSPTFDNAYTSLLDRLRDEFDGIKSQLDPSRQSIPFVNISYDEAVGLPTPNGNILLLGFGNGADNFSSSDRNTVNALGADAQAFRIAIARGIHHRVKQIIDHLKPTNGILIYGNAFDPQQNGGETQHTFLPGVDVVLAPNDGTNSDVLDLPGLTSSESAFLKQWLCVLPWYYASPFVTNFNIAESFEYFTSRGFRVGSWSAMLDALECNGVDSAQDALIGGARELKKNIDAGRILGSSKYIGISLAFYGANDSDPYIDCVSDNRIYAYPFWKSANGLYEQSRKFNSIELTKKYLF